MAVIPSGTRERSALLLELYGENAPEEPSLARQMRGAWVDGAGGAVLLDESFFLTEPIIRWAR